MDFEILDFPDIIDWNCHTTKLYYNIILYCLFQTRRKAYKLGKYWEIWQIIRLRKRKAAVLLYVIIVYMCVQDHSAWLLCSGSQCLHLRDRSVTVTWLHLVLVSVTGSPPTVTGSICLYSDSGGLLAYHINSVYLILLTKKTIYSSDKVLIFRLWLKSKTSDSYELL